MTLHTSADAPITCEYWDELVDEDGFLALGRNRYSCDYVVYTDGTYYYAEDGTTGNLDYGGPNNNGGVSGTNFRDVLNAVLTNLERGKICIGPGVFEWDDDFTPLDRRTFVWAAIAEQLRSRPGKWARIPGRPGNSTATLINQRRLVAFRDGRWQATTRLGDLYVRYLGPDPAALE